MLKVDLQLMELLPDSYLVDEFCYLVYEFAVLLPVDVEGWSLVDEVLLDNYLSIWVTYFAILVMNLLFFQQQMLTAGLQLMEFFQITISVSG